MLNYDSIFVIVDKGKGEDVVDAASEAELEEQLL